MLGRRGQIVVVAFAAATTLGASFLLKYPCTDHPWVDGYQLKHYCYSDVQYLYWARHLDQGRMPYLQEFNEYPVITGFFAYHLAQATGSVQSYSVATFLLLIAAGAATTACLWRMGLPWTRSLAWAAGPSLVVHATTNWDLLAVALATWGWLEWRKGHAFESAALFGLGGATKLYPAFFLPFLALAALAGRDRLRLERIAMGGFLGFAVPNLLVWNRSGDAWLATWRFQAERGPDFETPWEAVIRRHYEPKHPGFDWDGPGWAHIVTAATLLLLGAAALVLAWRQWRLRLDPLASGGIFTIAFLLVNRVYSPQYTLWALPILLALDVRWRAYWSYVAMDLLVFRVRYPLFTTPDGQDGGWDLSWLPWSRLFVVLRWLALSWCLGSVLVRQRFVPTWRPAAPPVGTVRSSAT